MRRFRDADERAALAMATATPTGPQVEVWWLDPSVWRHERVALDADGAIYHRYRSPAGFWTSWARLPGSAAPGSGITVNGQTGLVQIRSGSGVLRVTGTDGTPQCSDGPNWTLFYPC